MRAIRVAIADADEGFRSALVDVLEADARFSLAGVAATAEGIVSVVAATRPDLVLLDLGQPVDDEAAARSVAWLSPASSAEGRCDAPTTVVMSTLASPSTVVTMLRAGARGFLLKGRMGSDLAELLVRCVRGELVLAVPDVAAALDELAPEVETARVHTGRAG